MSKLDDILDEYLDGQWNRNMKTDIKALFLELIGKDYTSTKYGGGGELIHIANGEKARFRKKVEEL